LTYQEIAARGGGILNSAKKLNETSFEKLYNDASQRLTNLIRLGTGAIEIKSGYGLTFDGELKMLRIINKLKENFDIPIRSTFLGAHAYPSEFKNNKQDYLNFLVNELLPIVAKEKLADFIDVFCETNYFSVADSERIIVASKSYGLAAKIHVNQFTSIGGIEMACRNDALSVDHLEIMTDSDLQILKQSETIAVALPSCSFFIGIPYTNARTIIDSGCALALASDYNPGTSPSGNMQFVVSLGCIKMKMTPAESINAATINGAYAMGISAEIGSIAIGKKANFIVTKTLKSFREIPYLFGDNIVESVYIKGNIV
jgi:imidazolonepropionase